MTTQIKTNKEELGYFRKNKRYELSINNKIIIVDKWWIDDQISEEYECDYRILDQKDYNKLTEDEEEQLHDYIIDLK